MTDFQNINSRVLVPLELYHDKIIEIFAKYAHENGCLDITRLEDLIKSISEALSIDLEEVKLAFSEQSNKNKTFSNLETLTCEDLLEVLKSITPRKSDEGKDIGIQSPKNIASMCKKISGGNRLNRGRTIKSIAGQVTCIDVNQINKTRLDSKDDKDTLPLNYQNNKEKLNKLLAKNKGEFEEVFKEREDQETHMLSLMDYFGFMQECFYLDTVLLMERKTNDEDFFRSVNSYKRLMKIVESYFLNVKGIDKSSFDATKIQMTFEECFDILEHWFKIDEEVVLVDNQEKETKHAESSQDEVKNVLLETITKYQEMINKSTNEIEKNVLQTTIETLLQKLKELEPNKTKEAETVKDTYEEKQKSVLMALQEIFYFYVKQKIDVKKSVTFSNVEKQQKTVGLDQVSMLVDNFQIRINYIFLILLKKLEEMFKRESGHSQDLTFDKFIALFEKIAEVADFSSEDTKAESESSNLTHQSKNSLVVLLWKHMGLYDETYKKILENIQNTMSPQGDFKEGSENLNQDCKSHNSEPEIEHSKKLISKRSDIVKRSRNIKEILSDQVGGVKDYCGQSKNELYMIEATKAKLHPVSEKKLSRKETHGMNLVNAGSEWQPINLYQESLLPKDQVRQKTKLQGVKSRITAGILLRLNKIDHDIKKKEQEVMKNVMNIQNIKLEKGLRIAQRLS